MMARWLNEFIDLAGPVLEKAIWPLAGVVIAVLGFSLNRRKHKDEQHKEEILLRERVAKLEEKTGNTEINHERLAKRVLEVERRTNTKEDMRTLRYPIQEIPPKRARGGNSKREKPDRRKKEQNTHPKENKQP